MKKEITIEVDPEIGLYTIGMVTLFYDTLIEKSLAAFGGLSPRFKKILKTKEQDMKEFLDELYRKLRDSTTIEEDLANLIAKNNKKHELTDETRHDK